MTTKANVCKVSGLVNSDHLKTILKHKGSTLDIHALTPRTKMEELKGNVDIM